MVESFLVLVVAVVVFEVAVLRNVAVMLAVVVLRSAAVVLAAVVLRNVAVVWEVVVLRNVSVVFEVVVLPAAVVEVVVLLNAAAEVTVVVVIGAAVVREELRAVDGGGVTVKCASVLVEFGSVMVMADRSPIVKDAFGALSFLVPAVVSALAPSATSPAVIKFRSE